MPRPYGGGDECSDFKNPIGRPAKAGLSGNRIFAETEESRLSVKPRPYGRGASLPIHLKRIDEKMIDRNKSKDTSEDYFGFSAR